MCVYICVCIIYSVLLHTLTEYVGKGIEHELQFGDFPRQIMCGEYF